MRRMPIGAEIVQEGVHFRVNAPKCKQVEVLIANKKYPLVSEKNGYFSAFIGDAKENTLYSFILDGMNTVPDPASRFQPQGPHGPSQVINPDHYNWGDANWQGITDQAHAIIYELHIGTFTQEGSWLAACRLLPYLKELGITIIQMMPVAEFPGRFNWGYDGVDLFAPTHNYGQPDDLRRFIDEAHLLGLGVILDVVYNHFGPSGNYLALFSDDYFKNEKNEWGTAINYDGNHCKPLRELLIENAGYWIQEFHFDGLRLDACHSIVDKSKVHIIKEIARKVRAKAGFRKTYISAENEKQQTKFILPEEQGGYALDALYVEDFHHSAFVKLRGRFEAYFSDYRGKAQEFLSSIKYHFLYQGQWYSWQKQRRGSPAIGLPASQFVNFLENHDQIANTGNSSRLYDLCNPGLLRAMTSLLFLAPQTPLLFQGQEYGSSCPFYYFCEHEGELAKKIVDGREEFVSQFKSIDDPEFKKLILNPNSYNTFLQSKLQWREKEDNATIYQLHKDLIQMRKSDKILSRLSMCRVDGSVLSDDFFIVRYFSDSGELLLLFNFAADFAIYPAADPLLAPPLHLKWKLVWSSEMLRYGGQGYRKIEEGNWIITGNSATILKAE